MTDLLPLLTSANGTATRGEFLISAFALIVAGLVIGLVPVVGPIASLALLYPWTCLSMRRLADMGRPKALALIPLSLCGVAGALGLLTFAGASNPAALGATLMFAGFTLLVSSVAGLVALGFLVWIGLSNSKPETLAPAPSKMGN
ncbi:hypothetical protein ACMGDM_19870 [Sphingomonas sp. DT-51]|uniref:hypothetical protein n=1 Tax=Sphingomonas sp. DT-51 TaxID=3396165 RepID=UPI003F1AA951